MPRRRSSSTSPHDLGARGPRGVTVHVDVPGGSGFPDTAELMALAETLHSLALDLLPGAAAHTEVTFAGAPPRWTPGPADAEERAQSRSAVVQVSASTRPVERRP